MGPVLLSVVIVGASVSSVDDGVGSLLRNWRNRQREGVTMSLGGNGGGISEWDRDVVAWKLDADVLRERGDPAGEDRRWGLS